jgi:hypothetical protein
MASRNKAADRSPNLLAKVLGKGISINEARHGAPGLHSLPGLWPIWPEMQPWPASGAQNYAKFSAKIEA